MKYLMHNRESPKNVVAKTGGPLRPHAPVNVLPVSINNSALKNADRPSGYRFITASVQHNVAVW